MNVHSTIESFRHALEATRSQGTHVGFVPTMGALHAGHISLMNTARSNGDAVAVSIFVNPLQFGPSEDLAKYPRPLEEDLAACEAAGVGDVMVPAADEMYPNGVPTTSVHVSGVTDVLEGEHRPGHFDGVATVVTKLFGIVGACSAYFGEKDWQQLAVVRRLAGDLSMPVEVIGCPIVRDSDGLALSSRNVYLSPEERETALSLNRALTLGREMFDGGIVSTTALENSMRERLVSGGVSDIGYASVRDDDFETPQHVDRRCRLLVAAKIGTTRLIDNAGVA